MNIGRVLGGAPALCLVIANAWADAWTLAPLTAGGDVDHGITIAGTPFSHDGAWICYDCVRGMIRDASVIARVNTGSREIEGIYDAKSRPGIGPGVAAVRYFPDESGRIIFIHGPNAATGLNYERWRRYGGILDTRTAKVSAADARDVTPPYTPGALRGGTHVHVPGGPQSRWIGFTYDDMVMRKYGENTGQNWDLRTIGVTQLGTPVHVDANPENWDGDGFSVVLVRVTPTPTPGTDELSRAEGDCWVGDSGYERDGKRRLARAFVGTLCDSVRDVFVADIPDDIARAGAEPLSGTEKTYPAPPANTELRRITHNGAVDGYVRASSDGSRLVFQAKDKSGKTQLYSVPAVGGETAALTGFERGVESDACFLPAGDWLAVASGAAIYKVALDAPNDRPRTELLFKGPLPGAPRNLCFSPDGSMLAMNIAVEGRQQVFVLKKAMEHR